MERQLITDQFTNRMALDMGLAIIELARKRDARIGVSIRRLNQTVFEFIDNDLSADKANWIRRKVNTTLNFAESSLAVRLDLEQMGKTLAADFGLSDDDYIAKGGCIPIVVTSAGLIGTITVTGLKDVDDHQIIVDALPEFRFV
ncbi:heme-degrading domain-containing protein [Saccharospirillum alexandrii]|uniref:heme-degrading domain-containing protein n=1 Tax=Saccharospirillum alexandrii TaxID=2448477 RepID=UPI0037367056